MASFSQHRVEPGTTVKLRQIDTDGKDQPIERAEAEREFDQLRDELSDWQVRLHAMGKHKLLVIFQAMDAGGKDGTIRDVFKGIDPQGINVTSFKVPTPEELAHDFLWRVHRAVPGQGKIGIFNRSHYEDVLVVRAEELVPESVWRPRYELINDFEKLLTLTGTTILKFYLHISHKEQQKRLTERQNDPTKRWKFSPADWEKSKKWDDYREAYDDALTHCSTNHAAWHIIPADQNWYRNWAVMRVIVATCRALNPQFPTAS